MCVHMCVKECVSPYKWQPQHPSTDTKDHEPYAKYRRCRCSCAIKSNCHPVQKVQNPDPNGEPKAVDSSEQEKTTLRHQKESYGSEPKSLPSITTQKSTREEIPFRSKVSKHHEPQSRKTEREPKNAPNSGVQPSHKIHSNPFPIHYPNRPRAPKNPQTSIGPYCTIHAH